MQSSESVEFVVDDEPVIKDSAPTSTSYIQALKSISKTLVPTSGSNPSTTAIQEEEEEDDANPYQPRLQPLKSKGSEGRRTTRHTYHESLDKISRTGHEHQQPSSLLRQTVTSSSSHDEKLDHATKRGLPLLAKYILSPQFDKKQLRKVRSAGDLKTAHLSSDPFPDPRLDPAVTFKSADSALPKQSEKLKAKEERQYTDAEKEAALVVQRFYRFYCMKKHFDTIKTNVENRPVRPPSSRTTPRSFRRFQQYDPSKSIESVVKMETNSPKESSDSLIESPSHAIDMGKNDEKSQTIELNEAKQRMLRRCINDFNVDAGKGMVQLIRRECVENTAQSIALFLMKEERLSKTKIGEYLGTGDEMSNKVLKCFVNLLDLSGLDFVDALRKLLKTFRLPGEAQKIDRVVNEFSRRYCENNPKIFSNPDTGYVLAYSLIMLNTDAHNPNVKKKMSLQDFIRNNRGIDNKKDLPEDLLARMYLNIVHNEIKMKDGDNIYKIHEICSRIVGDLPNIAQPHRQFIREFNVQQIPELSKPNLHKHERTLFLFNDLIIVTKPRSNYYSSVTDEHQKYQLRSTFNFITMRIMEKTDRLWHCNIVELVNANGRLITMSFPIAEEKQEFVRVLGDFIKDVEEIQEEKRQKLQQLTMLRTMKAKQALENTYGMSGEPDRARFKKYGSLRAARSVLQAQSALMTGKQGKIADVKKAAPVIVENQYADFSERIQLDAPSPCPDLIPSASADATATPPPVEHAAQVRRRNTISGYNAKRKE